MNKLKGLMAIVAVSIGFTSCIVVATPRYRSNSPFLRGVGNYRSHSHYHHHHGGHHCHR